MTLARRGFSAARDLPTIGWLLATVVVAVAHDWVPVPRWLAIHLFLLGAATHSIVVWSQHFADAMLRTAPRRRAVERIEARLVALNSGVVLVVAGVVTHHALVTLAGAFAVATVAIWHAVLLVRQLRSALPARFATTVWFYVVAASLLPFGLALGFALLRAGDGEMHERLHVAHVVVNVCGWIGLTVLGTLITLWPTILGARIVQASAVRAVKALPLLAAGVIIAASGAVAGQRLAVVFGLACYLVGLFQLARGVVGAARVRPPTSYAALSIAAGLAWWAGCLAAVALYTAQAPDWSSVAGFLDRVAPYLVAGFVVQVLLGALSFLIPVALGGGPKSARASHRELSRAGRTRVVAINASLAVGLLPVPPTVRWVAASIIVAAVVAFLALLGRAVIAWSRVRKAL